MPSVLSRLNRLSSLLSSAVILAVGLVSCYSYTTRIINPHVTKASLSLSPLSTTLTHNNYYLYDTRLSIDIPRPETLFDWNVKQLYVSVIADLDHVETVIWDRKITRRNYKSPLKIKNGRPLYIWKGARNASLDSVAVRLEYHVMPFVGQVYRQVIASR